MNESDFCCIKQVTKSIPITIPLKYITKEIAAVSEILEGWKRQYVPKLQGVLVNYRNIRLSARTVAVHSSRTAPKCTITATFDLFCPTVGEIVKGTINRISREHIGCLIEGTINVSIHRQKHSPPALSKFIKINHPILFEIESFVYDRQTIRVRGRITPECVDLMKEVFPASQVNGILGKDDSAQSDDLFSNAGSVAEEAISSLDNFVELTNNRELKIEETLNAVIESPKTKSKKRKHESESPAVEHKKKKPKISNPNITKSSSNDDSSDLEQKVDEFIDTPKNKSQKRKRESESSPNVGQIDKKKLKLSDSISKSSSSDDSSDHEEKVDLDDDLLPTLQESPSKKLSKKNNSAEQIKKSISKSNPSSSDDSSDHEEKINLNDLLPNNQESPSKKLTKKPTTAEQVKKSISESSNSSSSGDSSDHDDESVLNSNTVAIKQEQESPSKKEHKKGKDKKKKKLKSSDKNESKKKKKSKKKDSKPKSKKKSKVSATGEVLKKDKKKSKKDKKDKKKDKTKNSESKPVKIKSELD